MRFIGRPKAICVEILGNVQFIGRLCRNFGRKSRSLVSGPASGRCRDFQRSRLGFWENSGRVLSHISNFLEICDKFKINGASSDAIRLRLFPFSLKEKAKLWLTSQPPIRSLQGMI
ncbi:Leucine-rich repeat family protein [Prunus dulcis]|uniref:Leucine-rich repeat family protein n=1 Tax=Prunus dulcis TaxID=3755 RepID=A0A4Y1QND9_PRUDU|nr:Leucine-rich repeat family protein [Prunus dulcis]